MNKVYLTSEEVHALFSGRYGNYSQTVNNAEGILPLVTKGFDKLVELHNQQKIVVYQMEVEGKKHTFIEFTDGKVNQEEIAELRKIAEFLVKIETQLGYNML